MSEKNQEDSKKIEILNSKIKDIQCTSKIIIILIILIIATQASLIWENTYSLSSRYSGVLLLVTTTFLVFSAIFIFCISSIQKSKETS
jgi:hypothetical protein